MSHIKKNQNCTREKEAEGRDPILTYTGPCNCEGQHIKNGCRHSGEQSSAMSCNEGFRAC